MSSIDPSEIKFQLQVIQMIFTIKNLEKLNIENFITRRRCDTFKHDRRHFVILCVLS